MLLLVSTANSAILVRWFYDSIYKLETTYPPKIHFFYQLSVLYPVYRPQPQKSTRSAGRAVSLTTGSNSRDRNGVCRLRKGGRQDSE